MHLVVLIVSHIDDASAHAHAEEPACVRQRQHLQQSQQQLSLWKFQELVNVLVLQVVFLRKQHNHKLN